MNNFIYPEAVKKLLINTKDDKIRNLDFYNIDDNKKLKDSFEKEQKIAKERYDYFTNIDSIKEKEKQQLNNFKLFSYTKNFDLYEKSYTNAYRKIYEICQNFNFLPNKKNIIHLDLCSFPGSFIYGINDFIKTKRKNTNYVFYFQSFVKNKNSKEKYFEDRYGLSKKYKKNFLIRKNGDIRSLTEINFLREKLKNKCDIVTSDCGLGDIKSKNYLREKQMTKIFLGQMVAGLGVIKKNGNFVMKYYHFYSNFNISLIYFLGLVFKKVYLVKPASSRQFTGKEIYIMSIGYKDNIDDKIFDQLKNILNNFKDENLDKSIINPKDINKEIYDNIINKMINYYDYKNNRIQLRYKIVDDYIGVKLEDNFDLYLKKKKQLAEISNKIEKKWLKKYNKEINYIKVKKEDQL